MKNTRLGATNKAAELRSRDQVVVGSVIHPGSFKASNHGLIGIAPTRQIILSRLRAAATAGRHPKLTLKVCQAGSAATYCFLYLTLGDRVTYADKHENHYYQELKKYQESFALRNA